MQSRFGVSSALAGAAALAVLSTSFAQIIAKTELNVERRGHTATELPNGKIVIIGGENASGPVGTALQSAEVYDPTFVMFWYADNMRTLRTRPIVHVLPDGKAQVIGGDAESTFEIFDAVAESFGPRARPLNDSNVLSDILGTR